MESENGGGAILHRSAAAVLLKNHRPLIRGHQSPQWGPFGGAALMAFFTKVLHFDLKALLRNCWTKMNREWEKPVGRLIADLPVFAVI